MGCIWEKKNKKKKTILDWTNLNNVVLDLSSLTLDCVDLSRFSAHFVDRKTLSMSAFYSSSIHVNIESLDATQSFSKVLRLYLSQLRTFYLILRWIQACLFFICYYEAVPTYWKRSFAQGTALVLPWGCRLLPTQPDTLEKKPRDKSTIFTADSTKKP